MTLTERQLAGHQRRTLRAMRKRLLAMSSQWDGIDQFNLHELEAAADRVEEVATGMVADDSNDEEHT